MDTYVDKLHPGTEQMLITQIFVLGGNRTPEPMA